LLVGVLLALAGIVTGCSVFDRSCRAYNTCLTGGAEGAGGDGGAGGTGGQGGAGDREGCRVDPAHGVTEGHCGVWVSVTLGDDGNPGTQAAPVKTLARAIDLAEAAEKGARYVYACGGTYPEAVGLPAGVSLFGGFECAEGWRYTGQPQRAVITAEADVVPLTLLHGDGVSLLGDVTVRAQDATGSGRSSIAVLALPGSQARFRRALIWAGNGTKGDDGENGSHDNQPALKGLPGNPGAAACTASPGAGGKAVASQCDPGDVASLSGQGGDGGVVVADGGGDGLQPPNPNLQGFGAGGQGQDAAQSTKCTGGSAGAHGNAGLHGFGAKAYGQLTSAGFVGAKGDDGTPGTPGQGGGGGGASLGGLACGAAPPGGAGGGSGGTGGCGGKAGKGGQAGGSSIGIALLSDGIYIDEIGKEPTVDIWTGNGGKGGNGGALQPGGTGGMPALGGAAFGGAGGVLAGCPGGAGGYGGNGGNGGGGHGGHSVAVVGTPGNQLIGPFAPKAGEAGLGGSGGNPSLPETFGQNGIAGSSADADP